MARSSYGSDRSGKPMHSYGRHARDDASAIAYMLSQTMSLEDAEAFFVTYPSESLAKLEKDYASFIAEFVGLTDGRRPAYLRRITKNQTNDTVAIFLILCVIVADRMGKMFSLRDKYVQALCPGAGFRVATEAMFRFTREMAELSTDYSWPDDAMDSADGSDL